MTCSLALTLAHWLLSLLLQKRSVCFVRLMDSALLLHSIFQDKIGRCIMTLTRAILEGEFTESFPLDGTESGRLNVHVKWAPQTITRD